MKTAIEDGLVIVSSILVNY